jgi:hypothetical protein
MCLWMMNEGLLHGGVLMNDLLYILLSLALVGISVALLALCARLMEG